MNEGIKDVQSQFDDRNLRVDKVGVKDIAYPVRVLDKVQGTQRTIARVNMYVDLPHYFKGTHMSRFIEILNEYRSEIGVRTFGAILRAMKERLAAEVAHLEMSFPYFLQKKAPVSGAEGLMEYRCKLLGSLAGGEEDIAVEVTVPVTTLCPCSREIADVGAHNQRSEVRVSFRFSQFVWIEDIIDLIESCASSPVYSILKREDEKYVTEQAYRRPMFVEDVVRAVAEKLLAHPDITWFSVESENFESIHNHSAYAYIERSKGPLAGEDR
jgi:GTP cyclohydrolase I